MNVILGTLKRIGKFVLLFFIAIYVTLYESVKYLLTGKAIVGRIVLLALYSGYVFSWFANRIIFIVLSFVWVLGELVFAIFIEKEDKKQKTEGVKPKGQKVSGFFVGMSFEDAKREYRRLMKQYHPDNGGSIEKAQQISREYSDYQKRYRRQEA